MDYKSEIEKIIEIEPNINFRSDPARLKIILNNLVANAYKYHNYDKEDPFIKIVVKKWKDGVELFVEDNGKGIDPEHIDKIFDIFFRAHHGSQGSGLGLYIVQEAIGKLGGTIDVNSTLNQGTEFKINLPLSIKPKPEVDKTELHQK